MVVAAPPPPPPPPPLPPALLGVRITISVAFGVMLLAVVRLLYGSRRRLAATPSTLAVTGTRWCSPSSGTSAAARPRAALFAFRFAVAVWQILVIVALCVSNARSPTKGGHWAFQFLFFTVWNYVLQSVFWCFAAAASAAAVCTASGPGPRLRRLTHVLFSICVPMALLVSVVLWGVLAPDAFRNHHPTQVLNFYSYNMHAANTCCLLADACCNRMLLKRGTLGLVLIWALVYAAFSWIQESQTHFWPYFFMRLDTYAAIGWYLALMALHVGAYVLVLVLSGLKARRQPSLVEQTAAEGYPVVEALVASQGA